MKNLNPLCEGWFGNLFNSPEKYFRKEILPKFENTIFNFMVKFLSNPRFKGYNLYKDCEIRDIELKDKVKQKYSCEVHWSALKKNSFVTSVSFDLPVVFDMQGHYKLGRMDVYCFS
jgi:hypothetical protein